MQSDRRHALVDLTTPEAVQDLRSAEARDLVKELDYTPETTHGSRARDWSDLGDRMNYITDFFRLRQQQKDLYIAPFTPAQVEKIKAGLIPSGSL